MMNARITIYVLRPALALSLVLVAACSNDSSVPADAAVDGATEAAAPDQGLDASTADQLPADQGSTVDGTPATATTWIRRMAAGVMGGPNALVALGQDLVLVGTTVEDGDASRDVWMVRLDAAGAIAWQKTLATSGWDQANAVVAAADGKLKVLGDVALNDGDAWLLEVSAADGTVIGQQRLGGPASDSGDVAIATSDGGLLLAGGTSSFGAVDNDLWIAKIDAAGSLQWQRRYDGEEIEQLSAAVQLPDGSFALVGVIQDFAESYLDALVLLVDGDGEALKALKIGGPQLDRADAVTAVADGIVVAGATKSYGSGQADLWLLKLGFDGALQWQKAIGTSGEEWADDVVALEHGGGGLLLVGRAGSGQDWDSAIWIVRLDDQATQITWGQLFDVPVDYDSPEAAIELGPEGIAVAAWTEDDDSGDSEWLVLRLDHQGQVAGGCDLLKKTQGTIQTTAAAVTEVPLTVADITLGVDATAVAAVDTAAQPVVVCGQ